MTEAMRNYQSGGEYGMPASLQRLEAGKHKQDWIEAFEKQQIYRPGDYYDRCAEENDAGARVTLLAYAEADLAGVAHLKMESDYPPFLEQAIPEVNDLNVFSAYRGRGIANLMLEEFERIAGHSHGIIGIGVGLFRSYGAAQRIYCRRGYIPDGNGVVYNHVEVTKGEMVRLDDDLNLYFTKILT